jgi:hypothetical protein
MDEQQKLKKIADLLRVVVRKRAQAKRTRGSVRAAKLRAEAAELELKVAKLRR